MDLSGRPLVDTPLDQTLFVERTGALRRALASTDRARNLLIPSAPRQGINPTDRRVLLIDEPPSGEIGHTLFGRLRDEVWQLPFLWVVAIDEHQRAALTRPPADAFFPVVLELKPLDPKDALELLQ